MHTEEAVVIEALSSTPNDDISIEQVLILAASVVSTVGGFLAWGEGWLTA